MTAVPAPSRAPYPYLDFLPAYSPQLVDTATRNLLDIYAQAERYLNAQWAAVVDNPLGGHARARVQELLASLERSRAHVDASVQEWIRTTYPGYYAGGATHMTARYDSPGFQWAQPHRDAVGLLAVDTYDSLLRATQYEPDTIKGTVRELARQTAAETFVGSETATQAGKSLADKLRAQGIANVTYADGKQVGISTYANMVMRARTAIAYNAGGINQGRTDGVEYFEISDGPDCGLAFHDDDTLANGLIVDGDTAATYPISHPNAIMEGSHVATLGRLEGAYRARWSGPIVRVRTAGGSRLAVGPNHPVLTARGWVPAQALCVGDDVIRCAPEIAAARAGHSDLDQVACVEDVFDALRPVSTYSRVVPTADDFHGDGNHCEGEVEIVRTERALSFVLDSPFVEQSREPVLVGAGAEHSFRADSGPFTFDPRAVDLTAPGGVRRGDVGRVVVAATKRDPAFAQPIGDDAIADAELCRDLTRRGAGPVLLDNVIDVELDSFVGQAFDLSTASHAYWCDGILVHNCVRDFLPRPDVTQADVEGGDVTSTIDEQSASDQEAFDLFLRQEGATSGLTLNQAANKFRRLERAGRAPRPERVSREPRTLRSLPPAAPAAPLVDSEMVQLARANIAQATQLEPHVTGAVSDAAASAGGEMAGLGDFRGADNDFRVKSEASLLRKLPEVMSEEGVDLPTAAASIHDNLRYTTLFDGPAYSAGVRAQIRQLEDGGFHVVRVRNTWEPGSPYRGINVRMATPDGYVFELQFHTPSSWALKNDQTMHDVYASIKGLPPGDPAYEAAMRFMIRQASGLPMPIGAVGALPTGYVTGE